MNYRVWSLVLLMTACGDALAGEAYPGEPLTKFSGAITTPSGLQVPADVRVAVLWHTALEGNDAPLPVAPLLGDVQVDPWGKLGRFTVSIHDLPPPSAFVRREGSEVRYALGVLLAYQDTNGNGKLDCRLAQFSPTIECDDKVVGGAPQAYILYTEGDWPKSAAPLFETPRYSEDLQVRSIDAGVRPRAGWSLLHLEAFEADHRSQNFCVCYSGPCAKPYTQENGWTCKPLGELLSPLEARPRVRPWRDDDVLELRTFANVNDVMFFWQMRLWENSDSGQ